MGYFPQKSPKITGSFAGDELQLVILPTELTTELTLEFVSFARRAFGCSKSNREYSHTTYTR